MDRSGGVSRQHPYLGGGRIARYTIEPCRTDNNAGAMNAADPRRAATSRAHRHDPQCDPCPQTMRWCTIPRSIVVSSTDGIHRGCHCPDQPVQPNSDPPRFTTSVLTDCNIHRKRRWHNQHTEGSRESGKQRFRQRPRKKAEPLIK
jgi:hypothetical protein